MPTLRDIFFETKNFSSFSELGFFANALGKPLTKVEKPSSVVIACATDEASSEARESMSIWFSFVKTTHSFVILQIVEPSSHSECLIALRKMRPVTLASLPFCSSLVSSKTNSKLI